MAKLTPEEKRIADKIQKYVESLHSYYSKPGRTRTNFCKGGAGACFSTIKFIQELKGEPDLEDLKKYPALIKKYEDDGHRVELIQYGDDNFEVHVSSVLNADNFGCSGKMDYDAAIEDFSRRTAELKGA